jgi:hypothetical protein
MTRLYGRAPRGRRLLAKAPFGHWKTTTFVAALRRAGLDAPMVLDGPILHFGIRLELPPAPITRRLMSP